MKIQPVGAVLFHADDRWTDRWMDGRADVTKLKVPFHKHANAPKSKGEVPEFGC